tara:strand:+ start:1611 stop:1793 length:183 start_codon:yes stop_codon:yes gene_type:complete
MTELNIKNRDASIKICGTIYNNEVEIEIEDDMRDLYAYAYLNKQNLIDLSKHITLLIEEM